LRQQYANRNQCSTGCLPPVPGFTEKQHHDDHDVERHRIHVQRGQHDAEPGSTSSIRVRAPTFAEMSDVYLVEVSPQLARCKRRQKLGFGLAHPVATNKTIILAFEVGL
jgi:hypothetical protein